MRPGARIHAVAKGRARRRASSLWLALLLAASALAAPGSRPGVFLEGANIPRARALAVDAAMLKGWQLTERGAAHVIFETLLEQPASAGPPGALPPDQTTLRIRADFIATPAGVNAYLYAEEVWWAGTSKEWIDDVTQRYRDNLMNALGSLKRQWIAFAGRPPIGGRPVVGTEPAAGMDGIDGMDDMPRVRVEPASAGDDEPEPQAAAAEEPAPPAPALAPAPAPAPVDVPVDVPVGTWAYYAESLAVQRGCTLGDLGAELLSADGGSELHRVHCADGSALRVRCDRNGCGLAP